MVVQITGNYKSSQYVEYNSPDGALPRPNPSANMDLSTELISYHIFVHEDGLVKLTSIFTQPNFTHRTTFVLNEEVEEVIGNVTWKVHAFIKPNLDILRVTRRAEIDGVLHERITQYLFTEQSLVVTTNRADTEDVIVAYKYHRMHPDEPIRIPVITNPDERVVPFPAEKHSAAPVPVPAEVNPDTPISPKLENIPDTPISPTPENSRASICPSPDKYRPPISPTPENSPDAPISPTPENNPGAPISPKLKNIPDTPTSPTPENSRASICPSPDKYRPPISPTPENNPDAPISPKLENNPDAPISPTPENNPDAPISPRLENNPDAPISPTPENNPDAPISQTKGKGKKKGKGKGKQ